MIEAEFSTDLKGFHLDADMKGEGLVLLSGENGSGKSTFLKSLSGLTAIQHGQVLINGVDVTRMAPQDRKVAYATQNSYFSHLNVRRHIMWAMGKGQDHTYVSRLEEAFGISFEGKLKDLSMGQRMRVTLATAFASKPRAILLDEVISNISNPETVLEEVKRISHEMSIDVVFVAHSIGEKSADHHYSMESGKMMRLF